MKTTQTIDHPEAKQIIDRIVEKALQQKKAAVIAVADSHGELSLRPHGRRSGLFHPHRG